MLKPTLIKRSGPRGGVQQQPQEPAVEQRAQVLGRVEEVQRRAGRGSVDHDEVPAAVRLRLGVQLAELLHRHVLLGAGELRRQGHIELVLQDRAAFSGVECAITTSSKVPLHVEHHRVQAAAGRGVDHRHRPRRVVQLADTERLGQPTGRVDGQHDDLAAGLGGAYRDRGGRRGLADAAGAAADDDLGLAITDDLVDVEERHGRRPAPPTSRRSSCGLQDQLIGQLLGDREDRALVDASRVEGDLDQWQAERGQPIMALLLLQRARGLDRELRGQGLVLLDRQPGTFKITEPAAAACS